MQMQTTSTRLLLVEDDARIGDAIASGLDNVGFEVDWVRDMPAAISALEAGVYNVAIFDIGLPSGSGLELLDWLRRRDPRLPVMLLTAYDTTADVVTGLNSGADDYMTKPFALEELVARVRAIVRRRSAQMSQKIEISDIAVDLASREVSVAGRPIDLGRREFDLLALLLEHEGRTLTRIQIESALYSVDQIVGSNSVEVHVHALRKKLRSELIRTVRGIGYVIECPR